MINKNKIEKYILLYLCSVSLIAAAQDENIRYEHYVYSDNIKSVKFHELGLYTSFPIINLGSGFLELSFDELDADVKTYVYTVTHCNRDWTPSNMSEMEYIDGFQEADIEDYEYSFGTQTVYTHYSLRIPNDDMTFTKSGNYLLKVYEDEDEKKLVITRRFMVVDPIMKVFPDMVRPATVSKMKSHQEIDFVVSHEGFEVRNPLTELSACILQNGRWDNAIMNIRPQFTRREEQLFTYQNKIVFEAGREFRPLDLRNFRVGTPDIRQVDLVGNTYDVTLHVDKKRIGNAHLDYPDLNGDFIIEYRDDNRGNRRQPTNNNSINIDEQNRIRFSLGLDTTARSLANRDEPFFNFDTYRPDDNDIRSDYGDVLFTLYSPTEFYDADVYIFGGLTDWQLKPEFKMVYNTAVTSYVGKATLKQGYYDYYYVTVPQKGGKPILEDIEGTWFETENYYTVLVYYRPFGKRYDMLVGARTFDSRF